MGDNILKSEVTEHISNRQTAKILYLQQELVQANDQIKDLEYMLKLNKEALRLSIEETPSKTDQITLDMPSLEPKSKEFAIISYFLEENKRLTIKNEILSKGRNLAQSRVFNISLNSL